jgi:hypothetical protein
VKLFTNSVTGSAKRPEKTVFGDGEDSIERSTEPSIERMAASIRTIGEGLRLSFEGKESENA